MQGSRKNSEKNKSTSSESDDEANIWARVAKSTRKLNKKQKESYLADRLSKPACLDTKPAVWKMTVKKQSSTKPVAKFESSRPITLKSVKKLQKLDRNELRRVRRGRDEIEQTLDLHGFRVAIARKRVEAFIHSAHAKGCKWVLIITGKGERGEGALKKETPNWLGILAEKGLVMGFDLAPPNMGGDGAVCVRLRKKKT